MTIIPITKEHFASLSGWQQFMASYLKIGELGYIYIDELCCIKFRISY